ncbi:MAG: succinate dehydrogenase, hydrophobic membrane anchor protein [Methylohalobius sp. ZOD2]
MSFRTPLGRARGLSAAGTGTGHWWVQRVTAVALIPLTLWFVWFLSRFLVLSHGEMVQWLARPAHAVLLLAYLGAAFYHALLGLQVVIEDYVHAPWLRTGSLLALKLVLIVLGLTAVFAALRIAFSS